MYSVNTSWIQAGYKVNTRSYLAHRLCDCLGVGDNVVALNDGYRTHITARLYLFSQRRYSHFIARSSGQGQKKGHISTTSWPIIWIQGAILEPLSAAIRSSFIHVNSFPGRRDMPLYLLDTRSGYKLNTRLVQGQYLRNRLGNNLVSERVLIARTEGYKVQVVSC